MADDTADRLAATLAARFGEAVPVPGDRTIPATWSTVAGRGSCRAFTPDPVPLALVETLAALALSSPSKSDLQQRDIVIVDDP
jgi:nitroreductase/FMN reductase [NAD(P)H]